MKIDFNYIGSSTKRSKCIFKKDLNEVEICQNRVILQSPRENLSTYCFVCEFIKEFLPNDSNKFVF